MARTRRTPIHLDTLKISSISTEGPTKTATGGVAADTLLKYGKKFTIEMQDAMGRYKTLTELYGATASKDKSILAITDKFPGEKTIVGTTFVIDQATGAKQPVKICIPIFNCDGIFNLTQDAEGDVTTFDLNGQIARFASETVGDVDETGKYTSGGDNSFYFFATDATMDSVMGAASVPSLNTNVYTSNEGYRYAMEDATNASQDGFAQLDEMLAKFGVVTVMDVDIYPAQRFTKDTIAAFETANSGLKDKVAIGEWDPTATFNEIKK